MKNFKKIFALITVICMLTTTMTVVFADETTSSLLEGFKKAGFKMAGDFYYEIATEPTEEANGTAKIVSLTENNYNNLTTLNIPATVTIDEKDYDVVEIANNAFFKDYAIYDSNGDGKLVSSGTDRDAFRKEIFGSDYASKITAINFAEDNKVTRIGDSALVSTKLVNAVFADNITYFGYNNFYNNSTIEYVHLPANLTNSGVGGSLFTNCHNLKTIELPTNAGFTKIPSKFLRNCTLENLVVPDNVTSVATDAFVVSGYTTTTVENIYGNASKNSVANQIAAMEGVNVQRVYATNFKTYDLEDGTCAVTNVESGTNLYGAVYMPEELNGKKVTALTYQNGNLFVNQKDLTEFYMADTITEIIPPAPDGKTEDNHYNNMFYGCENLKKLHLSNNLTGRIRNICPTDTKLKEIEIPAGVTIIDRSFKNQTNLKSVRTAPNSKLKQVIGGSGGSFDGCAGIEEFVILGRELVEFNPFYLIATTREDVIAKNPNLTIFTDNEEYAASTGILGMFANSYNFKISTDVDTQIMIDKVETSDSGVTATLRSRAYGFNKSADGESVKVICAVYNSNDTLAKIDMVNTGYDFTNSLLQEVVFDGVTVADDQNVKVFVWQNTSGAAPSTDAYDLKGDKRNIKYYAIGHSYLRHGPFVGWQTTGVWGMAATEPQYDYFHQVQKNLVDNLDCEVIALPENHSNYERLCNGTATKETYTESADYKQMKSVIEDTKPNLITIALGGNATAQDIVNLGAFYDILFEMIAEAKQPDAVVIFVPITDNQVVAGVPAAEKYGFTVVDVSYMHDNGGKAQESNPYYAFRDYPDYDPSTNRNVEFRTHPGNLGHKAIADSIFRTIKDEILEKIPANNDVTTDYDEEYGYAEYGTGNGGGTATEIKITTNPEDMKVNFNGFNVMRDDTNDWVVLSSADSGAGSTGASVSAENLSISSDYSKFYVTIRVDGEISGKNMLFKYTTASGTQTMTLPMVEGMHTYEFDISGVTEEITSIEVTPDLLKCTLYIRNMGFEK